MEKSKSIVKQASILALAGILVRIIGVLYRSPLTSLITDEGNGYYSAAYNIYALILLLSSYSIPTAISKLISERLALKQYANAKRIFYCAIVYVLVIGGVAALLAFFLAPYIVTAKNAVLAFRVLCPTIFLSGLLGVFRGYFQAYQTTLYTSISQIIEQIFCAIVSLLAAWWLIQPFLSTGGSKLASYGAAGSALGTGAGVVISIAYMVFVYIRKKSYYEEEPLEGEILEDYTAIFKTILAIVTPIILSTCVYNLITIISMYIFYWVLEFKGLGTVFISEQYGIFSTKYMTLQNVPVALASAMSAASIPAISSSFVTKNYRETKISIQNSIRITMFFIIPSAVGLMTLSYQIMGILFPQKESIMIATNLLRVGGPAIIFYGLSTITNGVLQALGYVKEPLHNAIKALIIHIILQFLVLLITPINVYALVICNIAYCFIVSYLNQRSLKRVLNFKQEMKKTFLLPMIASIIMAGFVLGSYYGLFYLTGRRVLIPFVISIVIGIIVYFVIMIFMYSDHLEELEQIPYMSKILNRIKR